jgi:[ribosomal protein S5]-alanine N-acetyltransferase
MELKGPGFTLRLWNMDDAVSLQKNADNPNVSDYLVDSFPYPYTMDDAIYWIKMMQDQHPRLNLAIDVDGEVVGGVGIQLRNDIYRKTALIGYWLGEPFWGRGIMTGVVKLMTEYAFANFDLVRLQAGILDNNPASMRVLEKAGFVKEGILHKAIVKNGILRDEHVYGLVRVEL